LNISSDAVYGDPEGLIDEDSEMSALNSHGIMHLVREKIVEQRLRCPIGHIRPTLIFGPNDPHNGYGPNSFLRSVLDGKNLFLFGEGEEERDHIHINDVANVCARMIEKKVTGGVNAATGEVTSFSEIANILKKFSPKDFDVRSKPRNGPMPHRGYRAFSNGRLRNLMGDYQFTSMKSYFEEVLS